MRIANAKANRFGPAFGLEVCFRSIRVLITHHVIKPLEHTSAQAGKARVLAWRAISVVWVDVASTWGAGQALLPAL